MPSARKLIAVPETIWSARRRDREDRVDERRAAPPASSADERGRRPTSRVTSAPQAPKKAPISIMPSSPMLTTPERSDVTPPSAANVSGVA